MAEQILANGRELLRQDTDGCRESRIGSAGLSSASLEHWLARLEAPLAELRQMARTGALDHLAIVSRDDDIAEAERAMIKLAHGARTIVFLGTGGSSLGGQTLAQLNGLEHSGQRR